MAARGSEGVRMRVRMSRPPNWMTRDFRGWQAGEYFVPLDISRANLAEAAQAWDHDREQFPRR